MKKSVAMLAVAGLIFFSMTKGLRAQDSLCGPAPSLPTSLQNDENIKGQLQGQADLLSKLVGKAELSGQVEAARKQLYQSSDQFFAAQKDAYLSYLFCLLITRDNSLSTEQKLKALNTFREPITGGQRGSSNILIYAQCHSEVLITTPLPPEGRLNVLHLWPIPEENGGGGLAEMFMTKGNDFAWPKPKNFPYLNGYQCSVVNYTDGPVFNIVMPLVEVFREIIRDPQELNTQHAGKITVSRHWQINIDKIDPGIGSSFKFYIYNTSDTMVLVSFPDTVMLQAGSDDVSQNIRLVHSNVPMQFWSQSFE